jgi:hypothetical protein
LDGKTTNSIPRGDSSPLTVVLCLDLLSGTDQIVGLVGDTNWQATLLADRARFDVRTNPAPQAGPYTFIVPGNPDDAANQPGGDSFATVTVNSNGSVKLSATLADQTKATQKVALSKSGSWPLYVPLYGGKGSILSWLAFTDSLDSDLSGTLSWIKPALPGAKLYRSGFALSFDVSGSRYRPPTNSTDRVLGFTDGTMTFTMGSDHFENAVAFTNDNKLINLASNKLTLIVTRPTGLFRGTVTPPGTSRTVSFNGALHQKGQYGSGFFTGTNQTGRAHLGQ